jgi:hypothetical protein
MQTKENTNPASEAVPHNFCCPYCQNKIGYLPIWCRFCLRVLDPRVKIDCIKCGEPILMSSRFCRFCDTLLRSDLPKRNVLVFKRNEPDDDPPFAGVRRMPIPFPPDDAVAIVTRL